MVASFGQEPDIAEGSSNLATIETDQPGHYDISYQLRYVEQNQRSGRDPWSLRHTGIYHHHERTGAVDVVVLLHPIRDPVIENTIATLELDPVKRNLLCRTPFLLHTWLFDCYSDNWRWYLRMLGERFANENNLAMVVNPEHAEPNASFLRVQRLRNTNDFVIFTRACCAGNLELLDRVAQLPVANAKQLTSYQSKTKGYMESADVLRERIQSLIDLVGEIREQLLSEQTLKADRSGTHSACITSLKPPKLTRSFET